ncbi:MAG: zinc ribbon domain-containing protein [Clostridiales bacterium]|nr:zinc ribbon domain-containing protein [Clostridiales bacterium]
MAFNSIIVLIFVAFVILVGGVLPCMIGFYVHKDAKARDMDATLWTIISVVLGFLGLVIYIVSRSSHEPSECPVCRKPVKSDFVVCPHCGTRLAASCPSCGMSVDPQWNLCPKCGVDLKQIGAQQIVAPRRKAKGADERLIVLLVASIATAFLLFLGIAVMLIV